MRVMIDPQANMHDNILSWIPAETAGSIFDIDQAGRRSPPDIAWR